MPALITHHLFGEHSVRLLPEDTIEGQEELLAFLIGNQGPDPFFSRFSSIPEKVASSRQLGHSFHDERMLDAFTALRDGVERLPDMDRRIGRAFALGMLSHYALDRSAHPLIFAEQYATIAASDELQGADDCVHAIIESDIDVWMLWQERHATVLDCLPARELGRTPRIERVAGALTSQVAHIVWSLDMGADEYGHALRDMEFIYRVIEPAGSNRARAVGAIERSFSDHSLVQSLAHRVTTSDECEFANLDHRSWENPFTGETSRDSFTDRFDAALEGWPALAESLVTGDGLTDQIAHLNYSGRPLDADECWEED